MGKAHKFVMSIPAGAHSLVFGCEWCGAIALHTNDSDNKDNKNVRGSECPNGIYLSHSKGDGWLSACKSCDVTPVGTKGQNGMCRYTCPVCNDYVEGRSWVEVASMWEHAQFRKMQTVGEME